MVAVVETSLGCTYAEKVTGFLPQSAAKLNLI